MRIVNVNVRARALGLALAAAAMTLVAQQTVSASPQKPAAKPKPAVAKAKAKPVATPTAAKPVAAAAAGAGGAVAATGAEAEGIIFERQQLMKQLETDTDKLGSIVAGELPKDQLLATTRAIAQGAKDSVAAFKDKVPGGRSKPAVWTDYPDFTQRMEAFARNAEAMAKLAEGGNVTAVTSVMGDALPCKQCHDIYREPKKRT